MSPVSLLERLEAECAQGWPEPWWPQDRAACFPWDAGMAGLYAYIDLVGDVVAAGRAHAHENPERRRAAA